MNLSDFRHTPFLGPAMLASPSRTPFSPRCVLTQSRPTGQIDVMVLYSESALATLGGIAPAQMETIILEGLVGTNEAFVNSEVSVRFKPVHIGPVRCEPLWRRMHISHLLGDKPLGVNVR